MHNVPYDPARRASQAQGAPVSLQKSPSILSATTTPLKGKPRIFAAMEAQDDEPQRPATAPHLISPPPPFPPSQFAEQPLHPHHHVLAKPHHEATPSQQQIHPVLANPHHEATPSQQIQHHHLQSSSLVPAAEFWTPKSCLDPLPPQVQFVNGTADRSSASFSTAPHEQQQQRQSRESAKRTPRSKTRACRGQRNLFANINNSNNNSCYSRPRTRPALGSSASLGTNLTLVARCRDTRTARTSLSRAPLTKSTTTSTVAAAAGIVRPAAKPTLHRRCRPKNRSPPILPRP